MNDEKPFTINMNKDLEKAIPIIEHHVLLNPKYCYEQYLEIYPKLSETHKRELLNLRRSIYKAAVEKNDYSTAYRSSSQGYENLDWLAPGEESEIRQRIVEIDQVILMAKNREKKDIIDVILPLRAKINILETLYIKTDLGNYKPLDDADEEDCDDENDGDLNLKEVPEIKKLYELDETDQLKDCYKQTQEKLHRSEMLSEMRSFIRQGPAPKEDLPSMEQKYNYLCN